MSQGPPSGPRVELTTTHVGGGGRAKLVALASVVILGSVVYVGMSGRSPAPVAPQRTSAPVAAATAAPAPTPAPTSHASPPPTPTPGRPTIAPWAPSRQLYAVDTAGAGFADGRNILVTSDGGALEGALSIRARPMGKIQVALSQMTIRQEGSVFRTISGWTIDTRRATTDSPPISLLDVMVEGRPGELGAVPLVQSGYRFSVMGLRSRRSLTLFFYIVPSPLTRPIGDDGLIGWPPATRAPPTR